MPSEGLMVKKSWLMGPRTSSSLPIDVCFRYVSITGRDCVKPSDESVVTYLVLEVYRCVEVRNLGVYALADHLAFACVHELAHLQDCCRGTEVTLSVTSTASTACAWLAAILHLQDHFRLSLPPPKPPPPPRPPPNPPPPRPRGAPRNDILFASWVFWRDICRG